MEIIIKLNPTEAKAAINTGSLSFLIESANVAQDQAEKEIIASKSQETKAEIKNDPQPAQPTCIPTMQQPVYTPQTTAPQPAVPVAPLAQAPMQTQIPAVGSIPTAAQTYSMEQLAVAATQLVDAGRRVELVNLLSSFGVQALTALPKEQYGAFATQLRAMGAKI